MMRQALRKVVWVLVPVALATMVPGRALAADYTLQTDLFYSVVTNLLSAASLSPDLMLPNVSVEKAVKDNVGLRVDLLSSSDFKAQWLDLETMWYPGRHDIGGLFAGGGLFGIRTRLGGYSAGLKAEVGYKWITRSGFTLGACVAHYQTLTGTATTDISMVTRPGIALGWSW